MIAVMRIKGICIRCDMLRVMPDGEYICSDCMGFSRKDYRGKVRPFFSDGGRFGKFEGRERPNTCHKKVRYGIFDAIREL